MSEEVRVPAVRRSPIVASGNRRLDVWIYRDENTALRAAAELAMSCGTRNQHYLSTLSQPTTRDRRTWSIATQYRSPITWCSRWMSVRRGETCRCFGTRQNRGRVGFLDCDVAVTVPVGSEPPIGRGPAPRETVLASRLLRQGGWRHNPPLVNQVHILCIGVVCGEVQPVPSTLHHQQRDTLIVLAW